MAEWGQIPTTSTSYRPTFFSVLPGRKITLWGWFFRKAKKARKNTYYLLRSSRKPISNLFASSNWEARSAYTTSLTIKDLLLKAFWRGASKFSKCLSYSFEKSMNTLVPRQWSSNLSLQFFYDLISGFITFKETGPFLKRTPLNYIS